MSSALARALGVAPLARLLDEPLNPAMRFGAFAVGEPNRAAFAAARRVAMQPGSPFNPLFIHGPCGEGKTHLLQAIAHRRRRLFPKEATLYLDADTLLIEYMEAVAREEEDGFIEMMRSIDMLILDDGHGLRANAETQKLLRKVLEELTDRGGRLVVGSSKPLDAMDLDRRLKRMLGSGRAAAIQSSDESLRFAALQAALARAQRRIRGAKVEKRALEFMAREIPSDLRTLLGGLNRLLAIARLNGRPATVATVKEELGDLLRASRRQATLDRIRRLLANP